MGFNYFALTGCVLAMAVASQAEEQFKETSEDARGISHGPMLGAVSEHTAALWVRTAGPGDVVISLSKIAAPTNQLVLNLKTEASTDQTGIARITDLEPGTTYRYVLSARESTFEGSITTLGPSLKDRPIRLVYGYGYAHADNKMEPGTSVFLEMVLRKPDLVCFLGDFPYTVKGGREEVRLGNQQLREVVGFRQLTASTPTYGIYDDHDFGPNDCDGTHPNADEALAAFKEYWPNPSYGLPNDKGIYCSFVVGPTEFFLLDGRYPARKKQGTMLGKSQFEWLCEGLKHSKCRYKVLVSGTQFGRVKDDGWAGKYYVDERNKLFSFMAENNLSGVIGISGDVHRSDITKLPIGKNRFFYDFTPGALSRNPRKPPKRLPATLVHSYGKADDHNMFGEIEFNPPSEKDSAIVYRSFSAKNGLIYEHRLSPSELGITDE